MPEQTFYIPEGTKTITQEIVQQAIEDETKRLSKKDKVNVNTFFTTVVIPDSVECIGEKAFANTYIRKIVNNSKKLKTINKNAFYKCVWLEEIDISEAEVIEDRVFDGCKSLQNVKLPSNMAFIPTRMFANCRDLESIDLPESITAIKTEAFIGCYNLRKIKIPKNVKKMYRRAFTNCKHLETVIMEDSVTELGAECFRDCSLVNIKLSNNISEIPKYCFYQNPFFSIELPDKLKTIREHSFANCRNLSTLDVPDSTLNINAGAFIFCDKLQRVNLPDSIYEIGANAFYKCSQLKFINLENVKIIQHSAFAYTGMLDITLNHCACISEDTFMDSAIQSVIIHNSDIIKESAFAGCKYLKTASIDAKKIEAYAFTETKIDNILLSANVKEVDECAF